MNTVPTSLNPNSLIMRDYARHDGRSASVRSLGFRVVPFSKDVPQRHGSWAGALLGLVLGLIAARPHGG